MSDVVRNAVPALFQLAAQIAVVVDLAVEDDHVASTGRVHRLRCTRIEVDDGEAAVAEHDAVLAPDALAVRPTTRHARQTGAQGGFSELIACLCERADQARTSGLPHLGEQPVPDVDESFARDALGVSRLDRATGLVAHRHVEREILQQRCRRSANCTASSRGTRKPSLPSVITPSGPPLRVDTTGTPHAIASSSTMPSPSSSDGSAKTLAP